MPETDPLRNNARGFQQLENGDVQITVSPDDWQRLLFVLGTATAACVMHGTPILTPPAILELANRMNEGNPNFKPYRIVEEKN